MIAGQLLGARDHFFTADDADVVRGQQVCWSGIGVPGAHRGQRGGGTCSTRESIQSHHNQVWGRNPQYIMRRPLDSDQRDSQGVHVADGPSGHDSVCHGFLELPER